MKKLTMAFLLCVSILTPLLAGCHSSPADSFANKSKDDQMKEMKGDPVVAAEMAKKYGQQGPPPGAAPAPSKP